MYTEVILNCAPVRQRLHGCREDVAPVRSSQLPKCGPRPPEEGSAGLSFRRQDRVLCYPIKALMNPSE